LSVEALAGGTKTLVLLFSVVFKAPMAVNEAVEPFNLLIDPIEPGLEPGRTNDSEPVGVLSLACPVVAFDANEIEFPPPGEESR
jgi:hypothetical protein